MSNPKEKAMELVNKFWHVEPLERQDGMEIQMAIKCALIAVDEILNEKLSEFNQIKIDFWLDVRNEINKL